jgi:hypothetical protein
MSHSIFIEPVYIEMPSIAYLADVPLAILTNASKARLYCPLDRSRDLPVAEQVQLPAAPRTQPLVTTNIDKRVANKITATLIALDVDEDGDVVPPTTSEVIVTKDPQLDSSTPIFRSKAAKDAFFDTLPSTIQLQLDQPFGKDNLKQCYYLQKTGKQALLHIYKSGYMTNSVKKKLECAFPPARQLNQLLRRYRDVDFSSLKGFQNNWQTLTELPLAQRDMATACLIHYNFSLPALVRWIGGPHTAEHRDNDTLFARLKETCCNEDYQQLVRIFTKGSPTYVNAECKQDNYNAYRNYGNHSSVNDNPAMVRKTLLKQVARGCSLMLDPDLTDFLENMKQTPQGILCLDHPYKNPRVICDSSYRPEDWCEAINDWTDKKNEPKLVFAGAFLATLTWIWNLRIQYPHEEIYVCDDDASNAFKQVKYPPNLAGLHSYVINGILFIETGQTFGDCTSPSNWEPIAVCRSQHAQALWHRSDTIDRTLPLLPPIEHQTPPTEQEVKFFVQANRDSQNNGVLDEHGQRRSPPYRHHVDDNLYADVAEFLVKTVCASALAIYEILGFPDGRQVGALSMEKLDTMYRPERKTVGYHICTRTMTVSLPQYKRDQTALVIEPWLTMETFTLLQGAELCGKLESASTCNRWVRPFFFSIQNTIRAALTKKWQSIRGYNKRMGIKQKRAKYNLPKHLERRLGPLIARDKAKLLWHSKCTFHIPSQVVQDLALLQNWLQDPTIKWERSIAHWVLRDPTFVTAGDASQLAGGAMCEELCFWFDVIWSDRIRRGCKLKPDDPGFIHINCLEFTVVLLQLAACIVALESSYATSVCGNKIPEIPHLLVWTDNTASKSWANRVTSSARRAQPLLGILSNLLRRSNIGFETEHIAGISNDGPDFISRPELANHVALSHYDRSKQIIANDERLKSWAFFRPSLEFTSVLESMLFSGLWVVPQSLPKNLGHFEPTVSIGLPFVSI